MEKTNIDLKAPIGWNELTDRQLHQLFFLLSRDYSKSEVKAICLLSWNKIKVIGRQDNGAYLLRFGKDFFEVTALQLASVLDPLDWMDALPPYPVRLSKIGRRKALAADFSGVSFETFIICDNLYQGYLITQDESLLNDLGGVLYGKEMKFDDVERTNIFYWFASLKGWLSRKYGDFFQPSGAASDGNLLGSATPSVEDAMNAQIRALTKGDVTKETEVLALETHRALTELNALAREYKEFNAKYGTK